MFSGRLFNLMAAVGDGQRLRFYPSNILLSADYVREHPDPLSAASTLQGPLRPGRGRRVRGAESRPRPAPAPD